jgi:hypothetical protein
VKAGLRNARDNCKHIGRPRVIGDAGRVAAVRAQGRSWRGISGETGSKTGELPSGRFLACPETYEFRVAAFRGGVISFPSGYLDNNLFLSSRLHRDTRSLGAGFDPHCPYQLSLSVHRTCESHEAAKASIKELRSAGPQDLELYRRDGRLTRTSQRRSNAVDRHRFGARLSIAQML